LKTKELIEEVVDNIELMKKSILAKAFCRELGINNESDGNSIEILKQILFEE
jgi:type I restriction enzyme S subunit